MGRLMHMCLATKEVAVLPRCPAFGDVTARKHTEEALRTVKQSDRTTLRYIKVYTSQFTDSSLIFCSFPTDHAHPPSCLGSDPLGDNSGLRISEHHFTSTARILALFSRSRTIDTGV